MNRNEEYRFFHKGWNGRKYYIRMTEEEIEERRKLHLFLGVITITPIMAIVMCFASGII